MSDTPKITKTEKVKDPRRVEAGKRLAAISKQAKEKKKVRERETTFVDSESHTNMECAGLLVGLAGVVVGVAGLFYMRRDECVSENNDVDKPSEEKTKPHTSPKQKLDSFD